MSSSLYVPYYQERENKLYTFLCVVFCTFLLLSNITLKVVYFPWFPNLALTSGIITYPITFLITDLVSEIWGEKKAKRMIILAFSMNLIMLFFTQATLRLPAHPAWVAPDNPFGYTSLEQYQTAFASVFSINGTILIGSLSAFLIAQLLDVKLFCFLRKKSNNRHLWLRNNVSTLVSQLVDTFIMNGIVLIWGLQLHLSDALHIMLSEYGYKVVFALLDTPFIYLFVYLLKKRFARNDYFHTKMA